MCGRVRSSSTSSRTRDEEGKQEDTVSYDITVVIVLKWFLTLREPILECIGFSLGIFEVYLSVIPVVSVLLVNLIVECGRKGLYVSQC